MYIGGVKKGQEEKRKEREREREKLTNVISNMIGKNEKDKKKWDGKWDGRDSAYKIIITDLLINVGSWEIWRCLSSEVRHRVGHLKLADYNVENLCLQHCMMIGS